MSNTTLFERLMTVAFCALALGAAACGNEAKSEDKTPTDSANTLPTQINKSNKTMTKTATAPDPVTTATIPSTTKLDPKADEPSFDELLKQGRSLVKKKEFSDAVDQFKLALDEKPENSRVRIDMARAYIKLGQARDARPHAAKAVKLKPKSSYAWNTLGRVELLEHKYDAAAASFKRATVENPKNLFAWNNLGLTYIKAKKLDEAVEALTKATELKGTKAYMWNNLGAAQEQLKSYDEARTAYEKAAAMGSWSAKRSIKRLDKQENDLDEDDDDSTKAKAPAKKNP